MIIQTVFEIKTINLLTALLLGNASGQFKPKYMWKNEFWINFIKVNIVEIIYPHTKEMDSAHLNEESRSRPRSDID